MFEIIDNIEFCGSNITYNDTHIIYKNAVQGVIGALGSVISRERVFMVEFTCEYDRVLDLSAETEIDVMLSHYRVDIEEQEGEFDVQMGLFTDATFETVAPVNYSISVPEVLYIGVQMPAATANPNLVLLLRITNAFVYQTNN